MKAKFTEQDLANEYKRGLLDGAFTFAHRMLASSSTGDAAPKTKRTYTRRRRRNVGEDKAVPVTPTRARIVRKSKSGRK